jgi:hypothetical protein
MNKRSSWIRCFEALLNILILSENFLMFEGRLLKIVIPE